MSDFRGTKYSRGVRNNNPGNIRKSKETWKGKVPLSQNTDGAFEQFTEMKYGIRALMRNAITWLLRGENTIEKLIYKWAPPTENRTDLYIKKVSEMIGIAKDEPIITLDADFLIKLSKAITKIENPIDYKYIPEKDYIEAVNILDMDLSMTRLFSKKKAQELT